MKNTIAIIISIITLICGCNKKTDYSRYTSQVDKKIDMLIDSANIYIERKDVTTALVHLKRAEKIIPETQDTILPCKVYKLIGWINENNGTNEIAIEYFDKALTYAQKAKNNDFIIDILLNKANILYNMNENEKAWKINEQARKYYDIADASQKSTMLKNIAYNEMLNGWVAKAEEHAYKAAILANDNSSAGNAVSLLCLIYLKQNKDERAQMLMSFIPQGNSTLQYNRLKVKTDYLEKKGDYKQALETYKELSILSDSINSSSRRFDIIKIQNQIDQEALKREKMEQSLKFSIAIIILLLIIFILTIWYYHRTQNLYKKYQERISNVREDIDSILRKKNARIQDLKSDIDKRMAEINEMKNKLPNKLSSNRTYDSIAETKLGIDTLYAILEKKNISQMGKKEQTAVSQILWTIDPEIAEIIGNKDQSLTPKETFFCIMERNGMDDRQKAESFCCSEQAIRSTKSRLGKKINLEWFK